MFRRWNHLSCWDGGVFSARNALGVYCEKWQMILISQFLRDRHDECARMGELLHICLAKQSNDRDQAGMRRNKKETGN